MLNSRKLPVLLLCVTALTSIFILSEPHVSTSPAQEVDLSLPSTDSKKQNNRMRKTHSDSGEKKKKAVTYSKMSYEELEVAKETFIAQKNYPSAIKYLDRMIKLCDNAIAIGKHMIEIADLLYLDSYYDRAAQKYAEYVAFYPGGEQFEYALYKATESSFACTLSYDRDQTKTEETLALAEQFLKQDHLTTYVTQVSSIRDQCCAKLAESDINVYYFYLKRGQLKQAEKRLADIRTAWVGRVLDIDSMVVVLEADLEAHKEEQAKKAEKVLLASNKKAQNKHMSERF